MRRRRGVWEIALGLALLAVSAGAQHATVPSRGGGVTSGNATSGFTANSLIWNGASVLGSGPKFLSGNLSLEVGTNYCPDAGANDTYVCTLQGGSLSAYSTGTKITLKANTANTGTATVAVDGLSAITITRRDDSTLQTGDISAGDYVPLVYDGNTFRLQRGFQSGVTYDGTTFAVTGAVTTTGNITIPQGGQIKNAGGANSYLSLSDSAGTGLYYGTNSFTTGTSTATIQVGGQNALQVGSDRGITIGGSGITGTTKALTATSVSGPDLHAGIPSKTVADNTITTFATMTLGNDTGGCTTLWYTVYAADATTAGSEGGQFTVCGTDVTSGAGGESCTASAVFGNVQDLQGSTLGVTFAVSTGTDLCNIRVTADTDIATPTALYIKWGALAGGRTLTPQ